MKTAGETQLAAVLAVALATALAAACGREPASVTWSTTVDTIGDTIVVRSTGSVWGETAELVQDLRIGLLEGAEEYMFGDIQSLAVGTDGAIYSYDSHLKVLRKHSATGDYVATLGREGEGPGEYKRGATPVWSSWPTAESCCAIRVTPESASIHRTGST